MKPKYRVRHKVTPIARLLRYDNPIKMQGDPDWAIKCKCLRKCVCDFWSAREQAVYAHMMKEKAGGA